RVADDTAFARLPVNPGQIYTRHRLTRGEFPQHIPWSDGWKLSSIAHQDENGVGSQRRGDLVNQLLVHHRHLVHDDRVDGERVVRAIKPVSSVVSESPMNRRRRIPGDV